MINIMKFTITFWLTYYLLHCYYRIKYLPLRIERRILLIYAYIQGWIDGMRGW